MKTPRQSHTSAGLLHLPLCGIALLSIVISLACAEAVAQNDPANEEALGRCRAIQDTVARAACYDSLVDSQSQSLETQRLMIENQRLREEMARRRNSPREDNTSEPAELVDAIAALDDRPNGWVITLGNGQIWQQVVNRVYRLREGQEVRIYPTIWGNDYRLTAKDIGGYIQVRRVR